MPQPRLVVAINRLKKRYKLRTYHFELGFVFLFLAVVAFISKKGWIEWVGVFAVYFSFAHATVAERLAEVQAREKEVTNKATVECFYKLEKYFYAKELCWCVYFFVLGAWSALAGVFIFLIYPMWRKWWRKYN